MTLLEVLGAPAFTGAAPRTAVVVAHPDDEVIGAGSRLPRLRDAWFVYVTDGAPQDGSDAARHGLTVDGYRERRRQERAAALALCGVAPGQLVELGAPDQQASCQLVRLARDLAAFLDANGIEAVLTQPYEGGHPDHDAAAFVAHAAAALARQRPQLVEMTAYHAGAGGIVLCDFLPDPPSDAGCVTVHLDEAAQRAKQALLERHATQRDTLHGYPLALERFRPAPRYDFRQPPHAGSLWYEARPWGMSGARFRELAAQALVELGLPSSP